MLLKNYIYDMGKTYIRLSMVKTNASMHPHGCMDAFYNLFQGNQDLAARALRSSL